MLAVHEPKLFKEQYKQLSVKQDLESMHCVKQNDPKVPIPLQFYVNIPVLGYMML